MIIRNILLLSVLSLAVFVSSTSISSVQNENKPLKEYSRLIEFIKTANIEEPLYAFDAFEKKLDPAVHQLNLAYFEEDPELLRKIRFELNTEELRWKLENFKRRLLFVPEIRKEYATLFKGYCDDVIDFVLTKTQLQNPFSALMTLNDEKPKLPEADAGITAFLVHNIAEEYVYSYGFYDSQQKKVVIELDQKVFIGEVGSYSSSISQAEDGTFVFARNNYTIWQNSAKNPYTALMVPVEETFHISLRDYTQKAIREKLVSDSVHSIVEVNRIVDEWIAIEEAIVGGLVYGLLPEFLSQSVTNFQPAWIEADLASKRKMKRYRYLNKGIQVVAELGINKSIDLYRLDPRAFRNLLTGNPETGSHL